VELLADDRLACCALGRASWRDGTSVHFSKPCLPWLGYFVKPAPSVELGTLRNREVGQGATIQEKVVFGPPVTTVISLTFATLHSPLCQSPYVTNVTV
jgi:hypothetical protein